MTDADGRLSVAALGSVEVTVTALLGSANARIADVLAYAPGSIISLDAKTDAPVGLLVNGVLVASGDIVLTDDGSLAIEIGAILKPQERAEPAP